MMKRAGQEAFRPKVLRWLVIALALALCFAPLGANPVAALSIGDYFSYTYSVVFSKTQVQGGETFYATVEGTATCKSNLPSWLVPSEVSVTGRITAKNQTSEASVTLNSSYTLKMPPPPLPSKVGESAKVSQVVSLQFPQGSQSGTYSVSGELIEAKVNTIFGWLSVTSYLPASQTIGSVTYTTGTTPTPSSSGGGGPAPSTPEPLPGTTDVSSFVGVNGIFTRAADVKSLDGKVRLTINKDTRALTQEGSPLNKIAVIEIKAPPAPQENYRRIGLAYDLGPEGVSFGPPITLTFTYDDSLVPEGVVEKALGIATWDKKASIWVALANCVVGPEANTISVPVSHFTAFTILADTRPAAFVTSDLSIAPGEVEAGGPVSISALVRNSGGLTGSHEVVIKINGVSAFNKVVTMIGGASEKVTFTATIGIAGTYTVDVDGQSGKFTVKPPAQPPVSPNSAAFIIGALAISPKEIDVGGSVTISVRITNAGQVAGSHEVSLRIGGVAIATKEVTLEGGASQQVTFTATGGSAGEYTVDVNGLPGTFKVKAPPPVPKPLTTRWLIGGIGGIILAAVVYLAVGRKRTSRA